MNIYERIVKEQADGMISKHFYAFGSTEFSITELKKSRDKNSRGWPTGSQIPSIINGVLIEDTITHVVA